MTDFFTPWCDAPTDERVKEHTSRVLVANDDAKGIDAVVAIMPKTYAKTTTLALIAENLDKEAVAQLLKNKMPTKANARSGDLGEILATAYIRDTMGYQTGPSRLIERDHQEWAMRGDDALGARLTAGKVHMVKLESKSRAKADGKTVTEARAGLARNDDLPSPHSTTQFAERLLVTDEPLGLAVLSAQLKTGLRPSDVSHVMFLFVGNHPASAVRDDLNAYAGKVTQVTVTVRARAHQDFIRKSYETTVDCAS